MEKTLLLKAEIREKTGTNSAAKLREQGMVPAVVYGHKQEPVAISLAAHALTEGLSSGSRVVDVQIGKQKETMMFKDVQYDYLGKNIIHVDLMRVDVAELVKVTVPIELKGASTAKGTHEGGIVEAHLNRLEIECKVNEIPESIVVLVKEMSVGDALHVSDIELSAGIKAITPESVLLATCSLVAAAKSTEELEAEAPAAPEVITEVAAEPGAGEEKKS